MTYPNDAYMTPEEVAALVLRPLSTLAYWRHRNEGPAYAKVGRRVLYRREAVERWLDKQFEGSDTDLRSAAERPGPSRLESYRKNKDRKSG